MANALLADFLAAWSHAFVHEVGLSALQVAVGAVPVRDRIADSLLAGTTLDERWLWDAMVETAPNKKHTAGRL